MDFQYSWVANDHSFSSKSPSFSSSSYGTHSSSRLLLEEDTSFNSLESTASTRNIPYNFSQNSTSDQFVKPSISHFCSGSFKTLTPQISCVAVQSDYIYAGTINEINVFDLRSYELVETFGSGLGLVKSIAFSEKKIFTAHQDCKIRVWQQVMPSSSSKRKAHKLIATLPTLKDRVFNSVLAKNYVQVRRHKKKLWIEHADTVSGLAVNNNDAGIMYSVSWDKSFKIWKTSSDMRCLESIKAHSDAINAVIVNPFGNTIYTGSADGSIKVWNKSGDSKKHLLLETLAKHESSVNALALMRDGSVLCSGGGDKVILVWERGDDCENYTHQMFVSCFLKGHRGPILCLVHVNGVLISGSSDKTVRIWRYEQDFLGCLAVLEGHSKPVKSLAAVSNEDDNMDETLSVFSGGLDGEIRVWKVVISNHREC